MKKSIDHITQARLLEELRIKSSAIDSAVNGIAFGDLEGRVTYGNAAAIALTGYTLEEVLGWSILTFADNQEEAAFILAHVLEKGSWIGEVAGRKKDGSRIVVHLSASLVRDDDGNPICTLCSFVDITRARQAFEELRLKDQAIASSINGIVFGDLEGRVTYANAAAFELTGYTLEEVLGWSILTFADNQEEAAFILAHVLEKGSWIGEVAGRKKDGSRVVVHLSASLVRDDDGNPICTLCSFVDITRARQAFEELRIKSTAIDSAVNGIAFGDIEGRVTYANAAALDLTGYTLEEVLGWSVLAFADDQEEAAHLFAEFMEKGSWSGEVAGRKKDGSRVVAHLSASQVHDEDGKPVGTLCSFIDITRSRQAFEELRIKSSAIDSAINGIIFGDLEGRVTYGNAAAIALTGYTLEEVLGWSVLTFADNQEEAALILAHVLEKGSWVGEVAGRKKDGSRIVVHLSASLVRDDDGKPICTLCSFVDITRARQAFEELRLKDHAIASSINAIVFGDLDARITYVNEAFLRLWGGDDASEVIGRSVFTFAESEQEVDRILQHVFEQGNWQGEFKGKAKDGHTLTIQISAHLVTDEQDRPICLMCSFVDITEKNRAQEALRQTLDELEQRVAERTIELTKANEKLRWEIEERKLAEKNLRKKERELNLNALHLEETNIALKVLLEQRDKDKNELEEKVLANVRGLLLPCLERLKGCHLNDRQKVYADILETNLQTIISPFLHSMSSRSLNFTPAEIQVAGLVKDGKTSKEIASLMNVSERGVEFHRNNIRQKLGLTNAKKNLRSYLLSLS
ncbi:MAG: PAS domain S-box protein [Smithella sp.]